MIRDRYSIVTANSKVKAVMKLKLKRCSFSFSFDSCSSVYCNEWKSSLSKPTVLVTQQNSSQATNRMNGVYAYHASCSGVRRIVTYSTFVIVVTYGSIISTRQRLTPADCHKTINTQAIGYSNKLMAKDCQIE